MKSLLLYTDTNFNFKLDLEISDLITKAQKKEIEFDAFHRRLTYLESLRGKENDN